MPELRDTYLDRMSTLQSLDLPRVQRVISGILISTIVLGIAILWFVPWMQTAYGEGEVSTPNPNQRIQAISALVSGQVKEWHVTEGQSVKAGDPIVTLVDADPALVQRLDNQIVAAQQQKDAQVAALATEENNLDRQQRLRDQGLTSQRDIEQATVAIQKLRAEIAKIDAEVNRLQVQKARQSLQTKIAPRDGTILRLFSSGNATFVKPGDMLASFIPDGVKRAAVLSVSGLDAPLINRGRKVRLQFEGWPVFQFSGWPQHGIGTFGGVVDFVEPVADQSGRFRVWVAQDPDDVDWPDQHFVRLGSRVRGWVLLEEVQLGYELWRQLNNFPPVQTIDTVYGENTDNKNGTDNSK